jgi:hypothetical protein
MAQEQQNTREFSVAMTATLEGDLRRHLDKGPHQEDLTFAAWRPVVGSERTSAILTRLILPAEGDRILQGNVAFTADYLSRALSELGSEEGLALIHCHFGPGWQGMSHDDVVAERDRLAGVSYGRTGLPVVGLTSGTEGAWSARRWVRAAPNQYMIEDASVVRVVGRRLGLTFHPRLRPPPRTGANQVATASVWGDSNQADLARCRVGIVGLGSVGSLVAESLARIGVQRFVLIDHDGIEERNLDRTAGATLADIGIAKVVVAERNIESTGTATDLVVETIPASLLTEKGYRAALGCDILFSCVDRPWPRHVLNALSYAHLIPVIDGGILVLVDGGHLVHATWRVQTVGPSRPCLVCVGAIKTEDVSLDIDGKLDEPDYIKGLSPERQRTLQRRNVFPFSMAVAAHEVLHFAGVVTGNERIGGIGPQTYHCFPGEMQVAAQGTCCDECGYNALLATASDLSVGFRRPIAQAGQS